MRAAHTVRLALDYLQPGMQVLDVGSGSGMHSKVFAQAGYEVFTCDNHHKADYQCKFEDMPTTRKFDLVWCSHVLEHVESPIAFLRKMPQVCKPDGLMVVIVPPMKPQIVGGHIHIYIPGILAYQAVYSGWDCSDAQLFQEGYSISLVNKNRLRPHVELTHDSGDIKRLLQWFPVNEQFTEGKEFTVVQM